MNKICTDVKQSRKLSKILKLESADMFYATETGTLIAEPPYDVEGCEPCVPFIPCYSLTALLNILPKGTRLLKSGIDDAYHCDCPRGNIDKWFDNPIDACVVIILKLHELNLL